MPIIDVEVVLDDPTLNELQMPMVTLANGNHHPCRFPCFENHHHFIGVGVPEVGIDKVVPSSFWSFQDGRAPFLATVLEPVLKLLSYVALSL